MTFSRDNGRDEDLRSKFLFQGVLLLLLFVLLLLVLFWVCFVFLLLL
jgi:hypothetical protein